MIRVSLGLLILALAIVALPFITIYFTVCLLHKLGDEVLELLNGS